ncbi:Asp23/Gls24 family envelope stress response protein [Streptomonospora sp. PA3]|uniref:Asp23/Gls24 family envelope stress response protein n=1 Tax=Streptomonospora sp. PA3 TaxID=2607326 RepID=UPI0012DD60E4|nr:Asp23/Gls24 family envelope stress response protein [Streptomonospora sp. PA3]MUL39926.1 Asp23/Gls24 family envelope stress response protein [Streptomonospora sp. PA3]
MSAPTAAPARIPPQRGEPEPAESRGRTVVGEDVVARIATRAAAEVSGVVRPTGRTGLGRGRVRARARVTGNGDTATLRLRIAVAYPRSVREVSRRVREHTARRVADMTGMAVRRVDIEIAELVRGSRAE